ncbi:glycosyltransferase [Desulfovibrio sp. OttesenSCG-928-C06]|nr:glycosyltransferase [Desulfovibrio sp. OttesenSCG-928-C06]
MKQKIIFVVAPHSQSMGIQRACYINNGLLLQNGILFPKISEINTIPGCPSQHTLQQIVSNVASQFKLETQLKYITEQKNKYKCDNIIISSSSFILSPASVVNLAKKMNEYMPNAELYLFFVPTRQDIVLEELYSIANLVNFLAPYHTWLKSVQPVFYDKMLLDIQGCFANIKTSFSRNITPDGALLKEFFIFCGLPEEAAQNANLSFKQIQLPLPQEFELFKHTCRQIGITSDFFTSQWYVSALNIESPHDVAKREQYVFTKQYRDQINSQCKNSNARASKILGIDLAEIFSQYPELEEPPYPQQYLSLEDACKVVEVLPCEFASEICRAFDSRPIQYCSHNERTCYEAIYSVYPEFFPLQPLRRIKTSPVMSVLTLTYNHANFIEQNIHSILEQQCNFNVQHIIADDCSTDGTQEIIMDYAARYPSILPVFQKNRDGASNIRTMFNMAHTEFVALCDGDDYFTDSGKLQLQYDFLQEHRECALCFHPVDVLYEGAPSRSRVFPPAGSLPAGRNIFALEDLIRYNFIQTNSVMYRWRFAKGLPAWFKSNLVPADWYWHLLHAENGGIGFIDRIMGVYRRHSESFFRMSEVDPLMHNVSMARNQLFTYNFLDAHFKSKYFDVFSDMASSVLADCLKYAELNDDFSLFDELVTRYSKFGSAFIKSLAL